MIIKAQQLSTPLDDIHKQTHTMNMLFISTSFHPNMFLGTSKIYINENANDLQIGTMNPPEYLRISIPRGEES